MTSRGDEFAACRRQISEPHFLKIAKLMNCMFGVNRLQLFFYQADEQYLDMKGHLSSEPILPRLVNAVKKHFSSGTGAMLNGLLGAD